MFVNWNNSSSNPYWNYNLEQNWNIHEYSSLFMFLEFQEAGAFYFLFSERLMAGVVTDQKNRCPAKSWRDLQSLEIDIDLNGALKALPEPK